MKFIVVLLVILFSSGSGVIYADACDDCDSQYSECKSKAWKKYLDCLFGGEEMQCLQQFNWDRFVCYLEYLACKSPCAPRDPG